MTRASNSSWAFVVFVSMKSGIVGWNMGIQYYWTLLTIEWSCNIWNLDTLLFNQWFYTLINSLFSYFQEKCIVGCSFSGFWAVQSIDSIEEDIIRARNVPRDKKRRKRKSERATVANIWQEYCVKKRVKTIKLFENSCKKKQTH